MPTLQAASTLHDSIHQGSVCTEGSVHMALRPRGSHWTALPLHMALPVTRGLPTQHGSMQASTQCGAVCALPVLGQDSLPHPFCAGGTHLCLVPGWPRTRAPPPQPQALLASSPVRGVKPTLTSVLGVKSRSHSPWGHRRPELLHPGIQSLGQWGAGLLTERPLRFPLPPICMDGQQANRPSGSSRAQGHSHCEAPGFPGPLSLAPAAQSPGPADWPPPL